MAAEEPENAIIPSDNQVVEEVVEDENDDLLFDYYGVRKMDNPVSSTEPHFLTYDDGIAETPENFKGELFPNQKLILAEMIEMVKNPTFCTDESGVKGYDFDPNREHYAMHSNVACISGPFSSGKSFLVSAYLCYIKNQDAINPPSLQMPEQYMHQLVSGSHAHTSITAYTVEKVSCEFKMPMFNASVVVVAASMFDPWCENLKNLVPHLVVAMISDLKSLNRFQEQYNKKKPGELSGCENVDVILVKLGGCNFGPDKKRQSLLLSVSQIMKGRFPRNIFVDDYDTAPLDTPHVPMWHARDMTWLICVNKSREKAVVYNASKYEDLDPYDRIMAVPMKFAGTPAVMKVFCAEPSADCIPELFACTKITYRNIIAKGNKKITGLLRALETDDEIQEMINADAFETAGQAFGGVASTPTELIKLILGSKHEKFAYFTMLRCIAGEHEKVVIEYEANNTPHKFNEDSSKYWNMLLRCDASKPVPDEKIQEYCLTEVKYAIEELDESIAKYSKILERFRDNLRNDENTCSCCAADCEGENVFIVAACCSFMLCRDCITTGGQIIKSCIFCARPISKKDIIFSPASNNISEILDDSAIQRREQEEAEKAKAEAEKVEEVKPNTYNTKQTILLELLQDAEEITCVEDKAIDCTVKGLLPQKNNIPPDEDTPKKYLLYTSLTETGRSLFNILSENNIKSVMLSGSVQNRVNVLANFKNDPDTRVLIANNSQDCAGINLPFLSHVVFYNETDSKIMSQVIGRGHRLGRTFNLKVIHITYENEVVRNLYDPTAAAEE